jgi:hypothetical protein
MHSILAILEAPADRNNREAVRSWSEAAQELRTAAEKDKAVEDFGGNIWLIRAEGGVPFLSQVLSMTQEQKQRCRLLFFETEPQWVRSYEAD